MADIKLQKLPKESSPDYFRKLVRNCIETFKSLPNSKMALDYNGVMGNLRAMILDDGEYIRETRNIYAKQRLEELAELDGFLKQTAPREETEADDDDDDWEAFDEPRGKKKSRDKKITTADKDALVLRFKAAQIKRDILADMAADANDAEKDAANLFFVTVSREEFGRLSAHEISPGVSDGGLDGLAGKKEEMPSGSNGKMRNRGKTEAVDDEAFFDVLENGEVVEK